MSDKTVLTDQSALSRVDRLFFCLESQLIFASGCIIFAMILISVVNILGRWVFSMPLNGYIDWIEQLMPVFAFLGIAFVQRQGSHVRMDMMIGQLKNRILYSMEILSVTLMLGMTIILCYGTYLHFYRAYSIGDSSLDIDLPLWPAKLIIPIAFAFLVIRLLIQLWGYCIAIKTNGKKIIAIPIIEDAKALAASEVDNIR